MPIIRTGDNATGIFDIFVANETALDTFDASDPRYYSFLSTDGFDFEINGSGITTDGTDAPTGGTVQPFGSLGAPYSISVDVGNNSFSNPDLTVTGLQVPLTELVDVSLSGSAFADNFWSTALGSADLFVLDMAYIQSMAGDGRGIASGETAFGANDRFVLFGTAPSGYVAISGDFRTMASDGSASLVGGDDEIVVQPGTTGITEIHGEIEFAYGFIVGGADMIDASFSTQGMQLFGDTYEISGSGSTLVGGDDELRGSTVGDSLYGDTRNAGEGTLTIGGDDIIYGEGGADAIYGDASMIPGSATVIGGDDELYGGEGNDFIQAGGGSDLIAGGTGSDTAEFADVDLTGAAIITVGGFLADITYIAQTVSGDVDTLLSIENVTTNQLPDFNPNTFVRFDGLAYAASFLDLAAAFSGDAGAINAAAAQHYAFSGYFEGRLGDGAILFDAEQYRENHADLAGLSDTDAALHYINFGAAEGRLGFDGLAYTASHADLIAAFGTNEAAAVAHYQASGRFEGRAVTFDAEQYLDNYADLAGAFGGDLAAATQHYVAAGFAEGRSAIDGLDYIASHADLIEAFGDYGNAVDNVNLAGVTHYTGSGAGEGRTVTFDAVQYLANYRDLREAFGTDQDAAAEHFIEFGYYEGRTDMDVFA